MKRIGLLLMPVLAALLMGAMVSGYNNFGPSNEEKSVLNCSETLVGPFPRGNLWNVTKEENLLFFGIALAYPFFNTEDMTQEEKDLRIQILGIKKDMIQKEVSYLNGEITIDDFNEELQKHFEEIKPLQQQMMEQFQPINMTSDYGKIKNMRGFRGDSHRTTGWGF